VTDRRNIEIKARCGDLAAAEDAARRFGAWRAARLSQEDTYFHVPEGRLKLRRIVDADAPGAAPARGELIFYRRVDRAEARRSDYALVDLRSDVDGLRRLLADTLGTVAIVRKERIVYLLESTRIHLDTVDALGDFIEIERVMAAGDSEGAARAEVERIAAALSVRSADLVAASYADLVAAAGAPTR
jgi:adenylate cyclase class IV